ETANPPATTAPNISKVATTFVAAAPEPSAGARSGLLTAVSIVVRPAQASTTAKAAITSDGRCQPPTIVETPVTAAYPPPRTATTGRADRGTTRSSAAATLAATVVCPLGSEFPGAVISL